MRGTPLTKGACQNQGPQSCNPPLRFLVLEGPGMFSFMNLVVEPPDLVFLWVGVVAEPTPHKSKKSKAIILGTSITCAVGTARVADHRLPLPEGLEEWFGKWATVCGPR